MKVNLAVQVLSQRVGRSLKFCREVLKLPQFAGSEATEEFCYFMNNIFDLLNSRYPTYNGYLSPLSALNVDMWSPVFERTKNFISGLQSLDGKNIVKYNSRKAGFLGIICNIEAVTEIFNETVVNGSLSYLLTYKLSQDHLEHFFGLIRARFGANNNPTPLQFKNTYRRLLLGITNNIVHNANVLIQDNSEIVALVPSVKDKINCICDIYNFDDVTVDDIKNVTFTEYKANVVEYVSGFVVKQILRKLNCNLCVSFIKFNQPESITLTKTRDFGNFLTYPSPFVLKITETSEKIIEIELKEKNWLTKKYYVDYLILKIITNFVSVHGNCFKTMDNHAYELTKQVISCYTCIRMKHHAKLLNENLKKTDYVQSCRNLFYKITSEVFSVK